LVKEGDINRLKDMRIQLIDLDKTDQNGVSLLDWTKKNDDQLLLDFFYQLVTKEFIDVSGFKLDTAKVDSSNRTILHWAIDCHQPASTIELLILQGAEITTIQANSSWDALRIAAREGQAEIVELLLNKGANINDRSRAGATALIFAIENEHKDVIDVLLKHNADITISLQTNGIYHTKFNVVAGDMPLDVEIKLGRKDIVQILPDNNADINIQANGWNALRIAAREGQAEIVELLLHKGADINSRSRAGATALIFAIENDHKDVVDVLLKHKADITISLRANGIYHNKFNVVAGDTPLHIASRLGNVAIVHSLLQRNADIKVTNSNDETPGKYSNELKLLDYSLKVNRRPVNHYKKSFTFFGYTMDFGYSAKQKQDAVEALKSVIFDNADKSSLDNHKEALNNGELFFIYSSFQFK
jgi:ankyrin repeat protein